MKEIYAFPERLVDLNSVFYRQEVFEDLLDRETARSLRSGRPFLLALINLSVFGPGEKLTIMGRQIASALFASTREIDLKGWYTEDAVIGVLFTEFGSMRDSIDAAKEGIVGRLSESFSRMFGDADMVRVSIAPDALSAERARMCDGSRSTWRGNLTRRGGDGPRGERETE